MDDGQGAVFIVDDDRSVRRSLTRLLNSFGYRAKEFDSAAQFLRQLPESRPDCLVIDVYLPGLDGLELQRVLAQADYELPTVFITGHGDITMAVRAMKAGAVDFLPKPFEAEQLLAAVSQALARGRNARTAQSERARIQSRLESLTPREHEVLASIVAGKLNKQIAAELRISEKTVKVHRSRIKEKMGVRSVAELVRATERVRR